MATKTCVVTADSIECDRAYFTPNVDRAIWIRGELNKSLLDRLRPRIHELTSQSREPISVFVDSNGGSASVLEQILDLLRSRGPRDEPSCHIITVALRRAESAAADLVSSGDFAVAIPTSAAIPRN